MKNVLIDFETVYDDECSVRLLGNQGYVEHPDFDAYMVSVVHEDGFEWCGNPRDFDWHLLNGCNIWAANAAFDECIHQWGVRNGHWPDPVGAVWDCALDMCRYLRYPGNLAGAVKMVFSHEMDKGTRDAMKGKRWESMTKEFQEEVTEYALEDSRWGLKLVMELEKYWPEWERRVSRHTRLMCQRGLAVDEPKLRSYVVKLKELRHDAEMGIPWKDDAKLLSKKAFNSHCRKVGLTPPHSLAQNVPEVDAWLKEHSDQKWIDSYRNWRKINTFCKKYEAFERGVVNGRYYPSLRYCQAHTRRWGGGSGQGNMQNLTKGEVFGTDMRSIFVASPGKKFVIVDLSQIELRLAIYLAGAMEAVEAMRGSGDLYETLASLFGLWNPESGVLKKENPDLRFDMKVVGLGVPYGASAAKVAQIAGITEEKAQWIIDKFFGAFPEVREVLHEGMMEKMRAAKRTKDRNCVFTLPSGNWLRYQKIRHGTQTFKSKDPITGEERVDKNSGMLCTFVKSDRPVTARPWHGLLTENCVSGYSLVLTEDRGWVSLSNLAAESRVWDGEEFVSHSGVVARGEQEIIECHGVRATPDHRFLVGDTWVRAERASSLPVGSVCLPHDESRAIDDRPLPPTNPPSVGQLRGARYSCLPKMAGWFSEFLGRYIGWVGAWADAGPDRQRRGVLPREHSLGVLEHASPEQAERDYNRRDSGGAGKAQPEPSHSGRKNPEGGAAEGSSYDTRRHTEQVYDILDCGPRRRFAVRGSIESPVLVAHNCCQAVGRDVLADAILRVEDAGWPVVLHVHDEVVVEVDEDKAGQCLEEVTKILSTAPHWAPDMPLAADGMIADHYTK